MPLSPDDQTYYNSLIQQLMGVKDPATAQLAQGYINNLNSAITTGAQIPAHGPLSQMTSILQLLQQSGNPNVSMTQSPIDGMPNYQFTGGPTISSGPGGSDGTAPMIPGNATPANALAGDTSASDQAKIEAEGQRQYQQTLGSIGDLGKSQQDYAAQTFARMLPNLAEDYNGQHLLNSTGYQQEAARQAAYLSQDVAAKNAGSVAQALTGLQGFQTSGLNRAFSVQDFMKQAELSKEIGAMSAPQVGGGKGAVGSTLSGIGSIATPLAYLAGGPGAGLAASAATSLPSRGGGGGGGGGGK